MSDNANNDNNSEQQQQQHPPRSRGLNFDALKQHVMAHKVDMGLWAIRLLTIMFTFGYFLPIFG